ncbi:MAG: hypothetical protein ACRDIY_15845 [Chloroflexota bacterium]
MPAPESAAYYRTPAPDEPIKTGDIFIGGALVAPGDPLLSLAPGFELRPPNRIATSYEGVIFAHSAPSREIVGVGPIVDDPLVGVGYVMPLSYTCDYSEPAKDHAHRLVAPLWNLSALPNDNGLRGFVWNHPDRCPTIFYPLPPLTGRFDPAYVNLRQMGLVQRELLVPHGRVAALQQSAKHLLWQKLAFFLTRIKPTIEQLKEVDSRYPSPEERP